jgi:peptide deformylase
VSIFPIRVFGDPVLRQRCREVAGVDGAVRRLSADMIETMYAAPGVGLAANQVGVQQRIFVYDIGESPRTILNPTIVETSGEWEYDEGCLSVPGLYFPIVRPKLTIVGDELLGRVFLHETDHLDGMLLIDRLDSDTRKEAMRALRERPADGAHRRLGA